MPCRTEFAWPTGRDRDTSTNHSPQHTQHNIAHSTVHYTLRCAPRCVTVQPCIRHYSARDRSAIAAARRNSASTFSPTARVAGLHAADGVHHHVLSPPSNDDDDSESWQQPRDATRLRRLATAVHSRAQLQTVTTSHSLTEPQRHLKKERELRPVQQYGLLGASASATVPDAVRSEGEVSDNRAQNLWTALRRRDGLAAGGTGAVTGLPEGSPKFWPRLHGLLLRRQRRTTVVWYCWCWPSASTFGPMYKATSCFTIIRHQTEIAWAQEPVAHACCLRIPVLGDRPGECGHGIFVDYTPL